MLEDDAARRLLAAERSRQPIRQLSLQYPGMTVEDAYRVQTSDPETGHLRTIVDTIAGNAADAGIVTGGRAVRPDAGPRRPGRGDLPVPLVPLCS